MWRASLGCSAIIAVPFFFAGLFISLFATRGALTESLGVAAMTAAMSFAAALILFMVDSNRAFSDRESVRRKLIERDDQSFDEFMATFEAGDHDLVDRIRSQLAQFFDVSASKLRSDDNLDAFAFDRFMPGIYLAVMSGLITRTHSPGEVISFPTRKLTTFSDLIEEGKALSKAD
jgi:hypothetical protein